MGTDHASTGQGPATARGARPPEGAGRARIAVAAMGTALVIAYAALMVLQILVLNPLAAAPGRTLEQIHLDMEAANQSLMPGFAIGIPAFGVALALVLAAIGMRARMPASVLGMGYLALLVVGSPAYLVASFGAGMSLADTYSIGGADHSPWSLLLHGTSFAAGMLLFLAMVGHALRHGLRSLRAGDHTPSTPSPR